MAWPASLVATLVYVLGAHAIALLTANISGIRAAVASSALPMKALPATATRPESAIRPVRVRQSAVPALGLAVSSTMTMPPLRVNWLRYTRNGGIVIVL